MDASTPMRGKTCLVTGATSGIGEVTARALAQMGANVVIAGRNLQRGAAAVERIRQLTGNPAVELLLADFAVLSEVRHLAEQFVRLHNRLDVLVNNAGAMFLFRRETVDGFEMTFAVNHLAPFLLTNLLLDTLRASAPARIVNVASGAHRRAELRFDDLQGRKRYLPMHVYGMSKLANILFSNELARRLEGTGVTVNALHPGFVRTNMGANNGWLVRLLLPLIHARSLSPEAGARTSIYLASSPEVEGVSGQYFSRCRPSLSSEAARDRAAAERLWRISAELTGLAQVA